MNSASRGLPFTPNKGENNDNHHKRSNISAEVFRKYYRVPEKNLEIIVDPTKDELIEEFKKIEEQVKAI